jgi:hypothetical protein
MVNRYPKWYAEGSTYPAPAKAATFTLGPNRRSTGWLTTKLNHLTNAPATIVHTRTVGRRARLTVTFDLPDLRYGSAARVLVRRADGTVRLLKIQPNSKGYGVITVGFGRGIVNSVTVIAVNGSTRYSCWQRTSFACNGIPLDQGRRVWFRATLR